MRLPKNTNSVLLIAFLGLLLASFWIYRDATTRGERFEGGQKLFASLDIDRIAAIRVQEWGEEERSLNLRRTGDEFVITEADGYPAKNESVNRLLRDLLDLTLAEEFDGSPGRAEELGLEPPGDNTVEVTLLESTGDPMVRLRVGDASSDGGNYLQRMEEGAPGTIYLSENSLFLNADVDSYLKKQALDLPREEVQEIRGPGFRLAKNDDGLLDLVEPEGATAQSTPRARLRSLVSPLRFDELFVADDQQVRNLVFEPRFEAVLEGLAYRIEVAESGERTFFRVSGYSDLQSITVDPEESQEELEGTAEMLTRIDDLEEFNRFHGSWVYEVTGTNGETLRYGAEEVVE